MRDALLFHSVTTRGWLPGQWSLRVRVREMGTLEEWISARIDLLNSKPVALQNVVDLIDRELGLRAQCAHGERLFKGGQNLEHEFEPQRASWCAQDPDLARVERRRRA
jgi:hypothetical protein